MPYKLKKDKAKHDKAYNARPIEKIRRAARNASLRLKLARDGDHDTSKLDVHHVDGDPENMSPSNMKLRSHKQRGIKRRERREERKEKRKEKTT
tara:strand:- start:1055 stop:1336 length:282 start_codon:yes stop_codon:yes gene_type:complete